MRFSSSAPASRASGQRSSSTRRAFTTIVVLEEGDGVGGAWHWNTYPGIAVDIPSFSYQFSFEKRSDWSRVYAPGEELKAYAEHCVDKYGLRDRIRLGTKVIGAEFDEEAHIWHIQTAGGETITARFVVGATGVFMPAKATGDPGHRDVRRDDDAHGPLGSLGRAARQAGRRHRHWRIGDPGDPGDRARGRAPDGLSAHARSGACRSPTRRSVRASGGAALGARRASSPTRWPARRSSRRRSCWPRTSPAPSPACGERAKAPGASTCAQSRTRRCASKLTPQLHARLQASELLQRVPADVQPRERRSSRRPRSKRSRRRRAHGRRCRAPDRRACLRDRLQGVRVGQHAAVRGSRRPAASASSEWWDANRFQAYEGVSVPGFPNWFSILGPYGFNGQSYFGLIETQMRHIVRCLQRARARRRDARGDTTRGEPPLLRVGARAPRQPDLLPGLMRDGQQLLLRQARRRAVSPQPDARGGMAQRRFDLDDYAFAK